MAEYLRFMSKAEFDAFLRGEKLVNETDHASTGRYTGSIGFCFLDADEYRPEFAYEFLSGIVSEDVCAVFSTDEEMSTSHGTYADPYGSFFSTINVEEFSTRTYDARAFALVRHAEPSYVEAWEWTHVKEAADHG